MTFSVYSEPVIKPNNKRKSITTPAESLLRRDATILTVAWPRTASHNPSIRRFHRNQNHSQTNAIYENFQWIIQFNFIHIFFQALNNENVKKMTGVRCDQIAVSSNMIPQYSMIQWNIFIPRAQHCVRLSFDRAHIRKCGNHTQNNKVTARVAHKMSENRVCMFAFHSCDREWQWKLDEYVRVRITSCSSFVDCSMLYVERNH